LGWCPGLRYSSKAEMARSRLRRVGCVFNDKNIHVNVQDSDLITRCGVGIGTGGSHTKAGGPGGVGNGAGWLFHGPCRVNWDIHAPDLWQGFFPEEHEPPLVPRPCWCMSLLPAGAVVV